MRISHSLLVLLALTGVLAVTPARAETVESCIGFIDALPATIQTQGTWCLNQDLATAITVGNAITVATNNVTIDCNGFKIGGLAAGEASQAHGIFANGQLNITVRNCAVRGFWRGIALSGSGHRVEDNRLDQSLQIGIAVFGDNHHVQGNRVFDTGGAPDSSVSYGITGSADIIDNTVDGVFATAANSGTSGISTFGGGSQVRGNRVRGLSAQGTGVANGIVAGATGVNVRDNTVALVQATPGNGVYGTGPQTSCTGNVVIGFGVAYFSCDQGYANVNL
ncbi:MAG TPA: hypothetical protein VGD21_06875 [Lysobacter sp.]